MSDILQYKVLSNKIEDALNEKIIGDVHVKYDFDPYLFGMAIMVVIDDPFNNIGFASPAPYYNNSSWHYRVKLDEYIVNCSIYDEEGTLKLLSEIVDDIVAEYKEHVYKIYFFD